MKDRLEGMVLKAVWHQLIFVWHRQNHLSSISSVLRVNSEAHFHRVH